MHDLPAVLYARGDQALFYSTIAAVLNSRKPRTVTAVDMWPVRTRRLVRHAIENGYTVASSYGTLPYCVVSLLVKGFPMVVACPDILPFMDSTARAKQFADKFGDLFDLERTLLVSSFSAGNLPPVAVRSAERDHLVAALSSVILVADIRPGGNMEAVLATTAARNLEIRGAMSDGAGIVTDMVDCTGIVRNIPGGRALAHPRMGREVRSGGIVPNVRREASRRKKVPSREASVPAIPMNRGGSVTPIPAAVPLDSSFLVHYTRSCPGPWPGQTIAEYCRSLVDGCENSAHTAFHTLHRILTERLIRGSNRLTRGPERVVSFTECLPGELNRLIKWHRGLIRWSFEPYGIAIRRKLLWILGASQVVYGDEELYLRLPQDDKYRFQLLKSGGSDWSREKEWRLIGDLNLKDVAKENFIVLVSEPHEAVIIEEAFDCPVALASYGTQTV